MRRHLVKATFALLFCFFCVPSYAAQLPIQGEWAGGFMFDKSWVALNARFRTEENSVSGTVDFVIPSRESAAGVSLTALDLQSSRLHFEIQSDSGNLIFDGQTKGDTISGTYRYAGAKGVFGLTRVTPIAPEAKAKFFGLYRVAPNKFISIADSIEGTPNQMLLTDYNSGDIRDLWHSSENTFFSGAGRRVSYPAELKVTFVSDSKGEVTKLVWRQSGMREKIATKVKLHEEPVTFQNGEITFSGTLISPAAKGSYPVMIIVPGAFRTSRNASRYFAHNFLSRGIAAFVYDARGTEGSTGVAGAGSFSDFANDALSAVRLLKTKKNVNPKQIGLFGWSNSAWTVTLAASRSKDVGFVITQSLISVPPYEQEIFRVENSLRADGFAETVVKEAGDFMRLKFEVGRTGEGWERIQEIMEKARGERWFPYTNPSRSLERLRQAWETQYSYNPVPAFEKITCPVFAFWGEIDRYVPVPKSIAIFQQSMKKAGNEDYTVRVFPRGRHDLVEGENGGPKEASRMKRLVPGYWNTMTDWLLRRVRVNK